MHTVRETLSLQEMLLPLVEWGRLWRQRGIIYQMTRRNILTRYRGSVLGFLWVMATPLLMLAVYTFIFSVVFKARWGGAGMSDTQVGFALVLFCGLAAYNIFSETLHMAASVITTHPNFVTKVLFPLEVLPVVSLMTALFFGLIWFAILLTGILVFLDTASWTMLALPLVLLPLVMLTAGLGWFVASLGVYFRDLPHLVSVLLQALFFLTPILYDLSMIPPPYRPIIAMNPLANIVQNVRGVLLYSRWPDWGRWAGLLIVSLIVAKLGYLWFMKTRRGFSDVL